MKENNELIAEFMGMQETNLGWVDGNRHILNDDCITALFFNTSWDWLMPVVDKIESLNYDVQIGGGMIARIVDIDLDRTKVMEEIEVSYPTRLETTYNAVVEFINEQNK